MSRIGYVDLGEADAEDMEAVVTAIEDAGYVTRKITGLDMFVIRPGADG